MVGDILLQIGLILLGLFMFLAMHDIPNKALSKLRLLLANKSKLQAKRHFVRGAQLLSQAQSPSAPPSAAASLSGSAVAEAENALALDPTDAASHILKALALAFQGFRTSALDSLDTALSPLAAKSLSGSERGEALLRRAELKIAMDRSARAESAAEDLKEAVRLMSSKSAKAYCLLGECYEAKEMREEARSAYEEALGVESTSAVAREALNRLGS